MKVLSVFNDKTATDVHTTTAFPVRGEQSTLSTEPTSTTAGATLTMAATEQDF